MGPTRRRPYAPRLSPEDRRVQLLDAALEIIAQDGYGALSIDAIARRAEVTRPVVYGVFEGLPALLIALLDRQEARALEQLTAVLARRSIAPDPDGFLVATVADLIAVVAENPLTWKPILLAPEGTPDVVRERIARDRDEVRSRFEQLLRIGLAARGGPVAVDVEVGAHGLVALAEYFGRMVLEDPDRIPADRIVATVEALLGALRAAPTAFDAPR